MEGYEFRPARIEGIRKTLPAEIQETIMELAGRYHVRDGVFHKDGSRGSIRITYKQLQDLLAFMMYSMGFRVKEVKDADEQNVAAGGEGERGVGASGGEQ